MSSSLRLSRQTKCVLAALLERPAQWRHGYQLMQDTGLKSGTLYPVLMRLADHQLVEAEWQPPVPPARLSRHAYRLNAAGQALAQEISVRRQPGSLRLPDGVPA